MENEIHLFGRESDDSGQWEGFFLNIIPIIPEGKTRNEVGFTCYQAYIESNRGTDKITTSLTMADTHKFFAHVAKAFNALKVSSEIKYSDLIFDVTDNRCKIRYTEPCIHSEADAALKIIYTTTDNSIESYTEEFDYDELEEIMMEQLIEVSIGSTKIKYVGYRYEHANDGTIKACSILAMQVDSVKASFTLYDGIQLREFVIRGEELKEFAPIFREIKALHTTAHEVNYSVFATLGDTGTMLTIRSVPRQPALHRVLSIMIGEVKIDLDYVVLEDLIERIEYVSK